MILLGRSKRLQGDDESINQSISQSIKVCSKTALSSRLKVEQLSSYALAVVSGIEVPMSRPGDTFTV